MECQHRRAHAGGGVYLFVCLQSKTHAVLATLKRAQNDMSSYQRKMFKVDDHMGIAIAGLTADGRVLCKYMRNECINHRYCSSSSGSSSSLCSSCCLAHTRRRPGQQRCLLCILLGHCVAVRLMSVSLQFPCVMYCWYLCSLHASTAFLQEQQLQLCAPKVSLLCFTDDISPWC